MGVFAAVFVSTSAGCTIVSSRIIHRLPRSYYVLDLKHMQRGRGPLGRLFQLGKTRPISMSGLRYWITTTIRVGIGGREAIPRYLRKRVINLWRRFMILWPCLSLTPPHPALNFIHHVFIRDRELHLQRQLIRLQELLKQTQHEPRLKGPFPVKLYRDILTSLQTILDKLHTMRCVTTREEW